MQLHALQVLLLQVTCNWAPHFSFATVEAPPTCVLPDSGPYWPGGLTCLPLEVDLKGDVAIPKSRTVCVAAASAATFDDNGGVLSLGTDCLFHSRVQLMPVSKHSDKSMPTA